MATEQIKCIDCGEEFDFTDRDREFYEEKQFAKPKRCKICRWNKKKARGEV